MILKLVGQVKSFLSPTLVLENLFLLAQLILGINIPNPNLNVSKMTKYFKILLINIGFILIVTITLTNERVAFYIEKPFIMLNLKFRAKVITAKNIIIVNIDRKSIELYGRWPWERKKMAELIDSISKYKPR